MTYLSVYHLYSCPVSFPLCFLVSTIEWLILWSLQPWHSIICFMGGVLKLSQAHVIWRALYSLYYQGQKLDDYFSFCEHPINIVYCPEQYKLPANPGANASCFLSTKTLLDQYIQREKRICSQLMIGLVAKQDSLTTWSHGAFWGLSVPPT